MYPKIFTKINEFLERINLSLFIVFICLGLIALVYYFIYALEKKEGYSKEKTNKLLVLLALSLGVTYLFAWFFDSLFHYFESGVFSGGMTYIGGFIGGIITFVVFVHYFLKDERKNILYILNLIIPGVILAHAIGRIGCFTAGCCYGIPTNSIFGVSFPEGTNPYFDGIVGKIHPTQLYESFFLFCLFFLIQNEKIKSIAFPFYLISYGIFRYILEIYFRGDSRGLLFNLPPSAILSLLMVLAGLIIVYFIKIKDKKRLSV